MIDQLIDLADSRNVALVLSLIANVIMGRIILGFLRKFEDSVSARESLANKIMSDYLEEKKSVEKIPDADRANQV